MNLPIEIESKKYIKIQSVLGVNPLTRFIFKHVEGKNNPTDDELMTFFCIWPDCKHSGAAFFGKIFRMKPVK